MLTIKNRLARILALLLLVVGVAVLATGCKPPGARALLAGKKLFDQGKYDAAAEKFKTATELLPTNAVAWSYLALAQHYSGDIKDAVTAYQQTLALNPNLIEAHYNLGCLLLDQNLPGAARAELMAFALNRPKDINGLLKLGAAQLRLRDWNNAEQSFGAALRLNNQIAEAWNGLGVVQAQRGRGLEASKDFNAAVQLQPDYAPALLNLAIVQQQQLGNRAAALEKYHAYLALKSAPNKDAVATLARALETELNPPVVAKVTPPVVPTPKPVVPTPPPTIVRPPPKPVVTPTPTPPPTVIVVKVPPTPKTNPPAQVEPVAVAVTPEPPKKIWPEVTPLPGQGSPAAIPPVEVVKIAPDVAPTPPKPKPRTIARYTFHSTAKPKPGNRAEAEVPFAQGLDAQEHHRLNEALTAFELATKADPSYFKAYYNLAWTAYALKDWPTALEAYETALVLDPESPNARYNFALTLKQAGYPLDAAYQLEKLLAKKPTDAPGHLLLANLYSQQLGGPEMARPHYLKVLELEPQHPQATQIRYWLAENPE
jgi:tetratricopeptide (TPR) repeat protein